MRRSRKTGGADTCGRLHAVVEVVVIIVLRRAGELDDVLSPAATESCCL